MKKEIVNKIIANQETIISELIAEMKSLNVLADIDEDDVIDPEDLSHKTEASEIEVLLSKQLLRAKKDLSFLTSNIDIVSSVIEPGALVYTDKYIFFIGVATMPLDVDGKTLLGISAKAPIYMLMKGKKAGELISYSGINYNIAKVI